MNPLKIVFLSNFLNHHQLPICLEFYNLLGDSFRFIATEPIHADRIEMGYADMNNSFPFVVRSYEDNIQYNIAKQFTAESDVAIIGSAPQSFVKRRIAENKLTFRYSERLFKKGKWRIISPRVLKYLLFDNLRHAQKKLYLLCAGAYAAEDYALVGAFHKKAFKWGYFPQVNTTDVTAKGNLENQGKITLLWAGRFIKLKHPALAIEIVKRLYENGNHIRLKIIGDGPLGAKLRAKVISEGLSEFIEFSGFLSPEMVLREMEKAEIFLFTSDNNEGWGAVLNEAMSSGCAVVASNAIGAVPYLITNGHNGLVYHNGDTNDLYEKTLLLIKDERFREKIGMQAVKTMRNEWSASVAVTRFIQLAHCIIEGKEPGLLFNNGPCSLA